MIFILPVSSLLLGLIILGVASLVANRRADQSRIKAEAELAEALREKHLAEQRLTRVKAQGLLLQTYGFELEAEAVLAEAALAVLKNPHP